MRERKVRVKALSIKEPQLSRIVDGSQTIVTMTWGAPIYLHGQSLLLVGAKEPKGCYSGRAACLVDVVDCQLMTKADETAACREIYPKAQSWVLRNVRKVRPISIKGRPGIYEVDNALIEVASHTNSNFV